MTFTTMTIGELCVSPFNVRQNQHDQGAIAGMAESLLSRGQLYPLVVHPMPIVGDGPQIWGALAGGRRYRAFRKLIDDGFLPSAHPIEVITRDITDEGELVDLSLAENLVRLELRPYEVFAAVARARDAGRTVSEIADTNGQAPDTVRRWERLGRLAPEIFAALEKEEITQAQASAFGATEDHELQLQTFREVMATAFASRRTPEAIRALLGVGDQEQRKLLTFVGEQEYRDAGGRYELDLFAEAAEERGRIADHELLLKMVEERLEERRTELRLLAGREIRFERDYPRNGSGSWAPVQRELEISTDDLPAIMQLPRSDIFATLVIEASGELETRWWWASRKAMRAGTKAGDTGAAAPAPVSTGPIGKPAPDGQALDCAYGYGARQTANAALREDQGLTAEAVDTLREIRREVLRVGLADEAKAGGDLASDFVIWTLARHELTGGRQHQYGTRHLANSHDSVINGVGDHLGRTEANRKWSALVEYVEAHPALQETDLVLGFRHFRAEKRAFRNTVAAIVAGLMLQRSANADGYRVPLHDLLGQACGLDDDQAVRALVEPTEEMVALLPKGQRIALATPYLDGATLKAMEAAKAKDTVGPIARALRSATAWIHPLLRFEGPADNG